MNESPLEKMGSHLEFLGYEIVKREDGSIAAKHGSYYNLVFRELGFGFLASVFFNPSAQAKQNRAEFIARTNAFNILARVARGYVDKEDSLVMEAFFPKFYDKVAFGAFISALNNDLGMFKREDVNLFDYLE